MKEENESAAPGDEDNSFDDSAIRDLPEPDATRDAAESVRGGTQLPTDKSRQIAHDM